MNTTSHHNRWTALVAKFNNARAAQEALAIKHDEAETAYQAFRETAPTRQITYAVEGRQYVVVSTGSAGTASGFLGLTPELRPSAGNNLFVFALPDRD